MILAFGDCELDLDRYELRRAGLLVPLEPQVFDVLVHLASHPDRVVSKEELLDTVWGDRFVSESALDEPGQGRAPRRRRRRDAPGGHRDRARPWLPDGRAGARARRQRSRSGERGARAVRRRPARPPGARRADAGARPCPRRGPERIRTAGVRGRRGRDREVGARPQLRRPGRGPRDGHGHRLRRPVDAPGARPHPRPRGPAPAGPPAGPRGRPQRHEPVPDPRGDRLGAWVRGRHRGPALGRRRDAGRHPPARRESARAAGGGRLDVPG